MLLIAKANDSNVMAGASPNKPPTHDATCGGPPEAGVRETYDAIHLGPRGEVRISPVDSSPPSAQTHCASASLPKMPTSSGTVMGDVFTLADIVNGVARGRRTKRGPSSPA